ncbi:hypothetical protein E2C01_007133 [Portunus trituberculatus]|uniref:Uncharacterized protein n=1 Tax=Portunus trituberculatus TaxID=210409 RepID=A0A5B7CYC7_PORTR|nr:hypothetical protein [Portunus trituberculatus]
MSFGHKLSLSGSSVTRLGPMALHWLLYFGSVSVCLIANVNDHNYCCSTCDGLFIPLRVTFSGYQCGGRHAGGGQEYRHPAPSLLTSSVLSCLGAKCEFLCDEKLLVRCVEKSGIRCEHTGVN